VLLVLDNYDSFTYNLVQYLGELGAEPAVYRNDALTVEAALALAPDAIVVSPGPGAPADAGICVPLSGRGRAVPVLGVCLDTRPSGSVRRLRGAGRAAHARKTGEVAHAGNGLFRSSVTPDRHAVSLAHRRVHRAAGRARDPPGRRIVLQDRDHGAPAPHAALFGVQFHPESIATREGKRLLGNFLSLLRGAAG
jgi:anthranilate synthase/aminodeoxychorismate synthase-like glutamine amidotransferase